MFKVLALKAPVCLLWQCRVHVLLFWYGFIWLYEVKWRLLWFCIWDVPNFRFSTLVFGFFRGFPWDELAPLIYPFLCLLESCTRYLVHSIDSMECSSGYLSLSLETGRFRGYKSYHVWEESYLSYRVFWMDNRERTSSRSVPWKSLTVGSRAPIF